MTKVKFIDKLEDIIDKLAIEHSINISLMRRGLYPLPGPWHFNFKSRGPNPFEKDLTKEAIKRLYDSAAVFIYYVGTLPNYIAHDKLFFRNYEELVGLAKNHNDLAQKVYGHEAAISYDLDKFHSREDFDISIYVNKALGFDKAKPFMVKLILLEQRLLELKKYLAIKPDIKCAANELMYYALQHEQLNIVNKELDRLQRKLQKSGHKNNKGKLEAKIESLTEVRQELQEFEKKYCKTDLYYAQLALYFLGDGIDSNEARNVRKWVDSHIEYETFRTIFANGIALKVKGNDKRSKKFIDLATEYAIYSRPNCAFLERIYTNRFKVFGAITQKLKEGQVTVTPGDITANKNSEANHKLVIGGRKFNPITFEEFEKFYLPDLENLGVTVNKASDGKIHLGFGEVLYNGLTTDKPIINQPNFGRFNYVIDDDMQLAGSKTNTISLYGQALMNASIGGTIGAIKLLPFMQPVTRYITPEMALFDDELPTLAFSIRKGVLPIIRHVKSNIDGSFYRFIPSDVLAEQLANASIEKNAYFSSYNTLKRASEKHSIESLLETSSSTDMIKNLFLTIGAVVAIKEGLKLDEMLHVPHYATVFPTFFLATWAAFSGVFNKGVYYLTDATQYVYNLRKNKN